jgi:PEGA domain-containing protein
VGGESRPEGAEVLKAVLGNRFPKGSAEGAPFCFLGTACTICVDFVSDKRIIACPRAPNKICGVCDRRVALKISPPVSLLVLLLSRVSFAQSASSQTPIAPKAQATPQQAVQETPPQTSFTSAKGFVLEEGTPVRLRINRTISSADAQVGDTVDFEVLDDITLNGILIISKGSLAFATVTAAQPKRRMARGGKLDMNIDYVKLASGEKAALRAVKDMKGGGHTGGMVGGMVATSIVFFPAAPLFLLMHGKDISIPKGTEITAYANGDMRLDVTQFQPVVPPDAVAEGASRSGSSENPASLSAKLQLGSDPTGADIEVDGSFVGNTPSEVQVTDGEHTVTVKKAGFRDWQRKLKVTSGSSVHLNAALEKIQSPQ